MNRILKSAVKFVAVAGITAYCYHKSHHAQNTAYKKTGKLLDTASQKHQYLNGSTEYRRQYRNELKKVERVEKFKKLISKF